MRRMVTFCTVMLAAFIALSIPTPVSAGVGVPPDVEKSAKQVFEKMFKDPKYQFRPQLMSQFGVKTEADMEKATLGEGFQLFGLSPQRILADDGPYDPNMHLGKSNSWTFIIRIEGKARMLMSFNTDTLTFTEHNVESGIIGSRQRVKQLDAVLATWPPSAGYGYKIVYYALSPNPYESFDTVMEISQHGKVLGFVPLFSPLESTTGPMKGRDTSADLRDPNLILEKSRSEARKGRPIPPDGEIVARSVFDQLIKDPQSKFRPEVVAGLGDDKEADLEKVVLGEGFLIYGLDPNRVLADDSGPYDPKMHLATSDAWRFLIRLDGEARMLMSFEAHAPNLGNVRYSQDAAVLDGVVKAWPPSSGYKYKIISNIFSPNPNDKFKNVIEISKNGKVMGFLPYYPLELPEQKPVAGKWTSADLRDPNAVLANTRNVLRRKWRK